MQVKVFYENDHFNKKNNKKMFGSKYKVRTNLYYSLKKNGTSPQKLTWNTALLNPNFATNQIKPHSPNFCGLSRYNLLRSNLNKYVSLIFNVNIWEYIEVGIQLNWITTYFK